MANISVEVVEVVDLGTETQRSVVSESPSPPRADTVVSMLRSLTVDDDYFHRQALRNTCIQRSPVDDFFPQASEILPGLFLCDLYTATSPAVLRQLGITHVVSVVRKPMHRYPKPMEHLCVPIDDRDDVNILDYLEFTIRWIRDALSRPEARVLVHCVWGMSRSASVVIAYLISSRRMSLNAAHRMVRNRRRVARPNAGFIAQLQVYERVTRLREAQEAKMYLNLDSDRGIDLDLDDLARRVGVLTSA